MKNSKIPNMVCLLWVVITAAQAQNLQQDNYQPATVSTDTAIFDTQWSTQTGNKIQTINEKEVPERITRNVIEDSKGHIWIASWDGVFKFNGMLFQNITKGVSDARFFTVLEDSKNNFWMASVGSGVYHFNGQSFINYSTENGLINDRVTNIYEDQAGQIWIGTEGGISIFDGSSFHHLTTEDGLPDNRVNSVVEDGTGKYWIGTSGQAAIYDPIVKSFSIIERAEDQTFENVRQIIKSSKGDLWLAGSNGLWRYDHKQFVQYSAAFTGYVSEDASGHIMTSSAGLTPDVWALNRLDSNQSSPIQMLTHKGMLFGFTKDAKGQMWYGALNGLYRYSDGSIYHYVVTP